jgi:hypothetical protein
MKSQINIRASQLTRRQLEELIENTGMTQTEIVSTAIDRMYREEIPMNRKLNSDEIYDMYANQADPCDLLRLGQDTIAKQLMELDSELDEQTAREYAASILKTAARNAS